MQPGKALLGTSSLRLKRRVRSALACLPALAAWALCGGCSPQEAAGPARQTVIVCAVQADRVRGEVPAGIFGTNAEWFNNAGGLWQGHTLDAGLVRLAREQGITVVRFPGGTLSDFYHWRDGIGARHRRPVRRHPTDSGSSGNPFGTPELARFCRFIGAEPLLTVNAGTGTPQEAAAWVAYCNAPGNAQRAADGLPGPLNVRLWEVGNELYLAGNAVEKKISLPPGAYASRFLAFAREMRRADPAIRLLALGVAPSTRIPLVAYRDWTETVLSRCAQDIDYVAVHNAYFPILLGEKNPPARAVYQALWAAPEAVDESLARLEAQIRRYEKGRRIGIAVTEWGALFHPLDPAWADHVKTMGTAVYCSRMLQVFLSRPRVELANYFKFTDATPMGWVAAGGVPKIPYYSMAMLTRHFGTVLVEAAIQGSPAFSCQRIGLTAAQKDVPELTAIAALSRGRDRLFINIVNRSWDSARTVRLKISGFQPAGDEALLWRLAADSPLAHNGPDLPDWWPVKALEPDGKAAPARHTAIDSTPVRLGGGITIPPHSVITVEIYGKTG